MSGLTCKRCESTFFPLADAWGASLCGDCIADAIESSLRRPELPRKPMKRAADLPSEARRAAERNPEPIDLPAARRA